MGYFYLIIAIVGEVIGTISVKNSDGFSHPIHTILVVVGYGIAFYFILTCVLDKKHCRNPEDVFISIKYFLYQW